MLRVLQFGMSYNRGGIETFLFNYYKNMDHKKVQFDFVKTGPEKIPFEDEILAMGGRVYEFKACGIKKGYFKNRRQWLNFFEMVKPDAVHYNTIALSSLCALKYAKMSNIHMRIAHVHSSTFSNVLPNIKAKSIIKLNKYLVSCYATDLWACSYAAGKRAFNREFNVIPNAIDMERFKFDPFQRERIRRSMHMEDKLVICNVGRLSDTKNQSFLLEVFVRIKDKIPDASLLLLGEGDLRQSLMQKTQESGIADDVLFMRNVSEVEHYLSASDLFVFPSKSEGFGSVLLEAQANGLKCFASADVIPSETNATGSITFLSLDESADYWAKRILQSLPAVRIAQSDIEKIKKKYDIKLCSHQLQNMYLGR